MKTQPPRFHFDNSYVRELAGCYAHALPAQVPAPALLFFNAPLAADLGLAIETDTFEQWAPYFAGNLLPEGAEPIAQIYAGHQFGHFSPQLGDGRALLLGEVIDTTGRRHDLAFKGSGRTAFSRTGDGKAAVGPMLREALISEAMHALGIPTTRSLAVVATGEPVYREDILPGAVLTRTAASHLRVGTFEYFAARGDLDRVRQLADYAIARHDEEWRQAPERYLHFLQAVAERQAALVARWMNAGFIHGVMNTDNMAISGETIDYGPCAFLEHYDPAAVFSSIDRQGRYAFGRQPLIAQWNLARLAEALLPFLADEEQHAIALATGVLDTFPARYQYHWLRGVRAKLGLHEASQQHKDDPGQKQGDDAAQASDMTLALDWLALLKENRVDFTLAWRHLAEAAAGHSAPLQALFSDAEVLSPWLSRWQQRCQDDDQQATSAGTLPGLSRADRMRQVNPRIIPRNHRVEEALEAATGGDMAPFQRLMSAVCTPFSDDPGLAPYAEPAPAAVTACYKTYCGT